MYSRRSPSNGMSNTYMIVERYAVANSTVQIAEQIPIPEASYDERLKEWEILLSQGDLFVTLFQDAPKPPDALNSNAQSFSTGTILVGMGDGSVRTVSSSVKPQTWYAAGTPADGDQLGSDW